MNVEMEEMPLVSVVVPVYNSEKYILQCIESICKQTYDNLEIIVINDGSTDKSLQVLNECVKKDKRIQLISIENSGVSVARNIGINHAKGKYISFVDSDDFIKENMIESLVEAMQNQIYGMAISGIEMCYYKKNGVKCIDILPGIDSVQNEEDFKNTFAKLYQTKSYLSPWAKLYRLSIIKKENIYFREDIHLGEDMLFNFDYLRQDFTSVIINKPLYFYRIEKKDSLTKNYTRERLLNNEILLNESIRFMEEQEINTMFESIAKYYFVGSLLVIQGYLIDREECKNVIQQILDSQAIKYVCKEHNVSSIELKLYQKIFRSKKIYLIKLVSYARFLAKKIFR